MTVMAAQLPLARPRRKRVATAVQWTLAFALLAAAGLLGIARFALHVDASPVLTGSMRPTFAPGDAVITRPVAVDRLRPGMVIEAVPPGESAPYAHRVISVRRQAGTVVVRTRGDANSAPDPWRDTFSQSTVPHVVGSAPKLGYVIEAVRGHTTQRAAVPVALAGLLVTALACALILSTCPGRPVAASG